MARAWLNAALERLQRRTQGEQPHSKPSTILSKEQYSIERICRVQYANDKPALPQMPVVEPFRKFSANVLSKHWVDLEYMGQSIESKFGIFNSLGRSS
jgi:hypothetical protein